MFLRVMLLLKFKIPFLANIKLSDLKFSCCFPSFQGIMYLVQPLLTYTPRTGEPVWILEKQVRIRIPFLDIVNIDYTITSFFRRKLTVALLSFISSFLFQFVNYIFRCTQYKRCTVWNKLHCCIYTYI